VIGDEMEFWYSGEIEDDVGDAFGRASNEVEAVLNQELGGLAVGSELARWDSIPMIRPEEFSFDYPEVRRYRRKDKSIEFRLRIDHARFKQGDHAAQCGLLIESLLKSVEDARKLVPSTVDLDTLGNAIRRVAQTRKWI
jgi:hypothetical protein